MTEPNSRAGSPTTWHRATGLASAAVWLHQGLWCKVLGRDPSHRQVLASLPGLEGGRAQVAATSLGLAETAFAVLVATKGQRRWVAGLQTALVVAFNLGGLAVGRDHIDHPQRLLIRNGAFLALVWSAVDD
jgi:DoxX-like family